MKPPLLLLLAVLLTGMSCREKRLPYNDDYTATAGFEHCNNWGAFNVASPGCLFNDNTYYLFSEDYCAGSCNEQIAKFEKQNGFIQLRSSSDLINWKYEGSILKDLPADARLLLKNQPENERIRIFPHILKYRNKIRMYVSLQCENALTSWIGLFESEEIKGIWRYSGQIHLPLNMYSQGGISILSDFKSNSQWMFYNSLNEGLRCIRINSITGFPVKPNDPGTFVSKKQSLLRNQNAPFVFYNQLTGYYYLFISYGPEITTYNVRVGRSRKPDGPYLDYYGNNFCDPVDHLPILIHPYSFNHHKGWAGTGYLSIIKNSHNNYFAIHQARLSPDNVLSHLHVRRIYWSKNGWPVLSPERYAGIVDSHVSKTEIGGCWEIVIIKPSTYKRTTNNNGQILDGENQLAAEEVCQSSIYELNKNGSICNSAQGNWFYDEHTAISLQIGNFNAKNLTIHRGFDWEYNCKTILFTGFDDNGYCIWGKRIHAIK